jgi:hypothetical protein
MPVCKPVPEILMGPDRVCCLSGLNFESIVKNKEGQKYSDFAKCWKIIKEAKSKGMKAIKADDIIALFLLVIA